jgi:hypothetical protein
VPGREARTDHPKGPRTPLGTCRPNTCKHSKPSSLVLVPLRSALVCAWAQNSPALTPRMRRWPLHGSSFRFPLPSQFRVQLRQHGRRAVYGPHRPGLDVRACGVGSFWPDGDCVGQQRHRVHERQHAQLARCSGRGERVQVVLFGLRFVVAVLLSHPETISQTDHVPDAFGYDDINNSCAANGTLDGGSTYQEISWFSNQSSSTYNVLDIFATRTSIFTTGTRRTCATPGDFLGPACIDCDPSPLTVHSGVLVHLLRRVLFHFQPPDRCAHRPAHSSPDD